MFPLEEPEFESRMCLGLTGVTMDRLAPLATELESTCSDITAEDWSDTLY
jgi:hypothetical protein